ncbi:MAG: TetR/AcrR family transcriptional regulator [Devosia sp.]
MLISEEATDAKPGRRVAGQDPVKRAQILDGAKRCFLSVGFEAASMNEITSEAGVSKGTLYVYFKDKEDLFKELIDREKSAVAGAAKKELERPGSMAEKLHRFGTYVTSRLTSEDVIRAQRMVLGIAERMPEIPTRFFGSDAFSAHLLLQAYLDTQVAAGELVIDDTELAARQFLELSMASVFKRRLFGNLPAPMPMPEIEHVVDKAVDMFLCYYGRH